MRRGNWVIWWTRRWTAQNPHATWEGNVGLLLHRVQRTGGLTQRRGDWRVRFPEGIKTVERDQLRELTARSLVWPDPTRGPG